MKYKIVILLCFIFYSSFSGLVFANNQSIPPRAVFNAVGSQKIDNLRCANQSIPKTLGIFGYVYKNSSYGEFTNDGSTVHGQEVEITCDTKNDYYDNKMLDSYTMRCDNGRWVNISNNVCVKKCRFSKSEFTNDNVVARSGLAGNNTSQDEIVNFMSATANGIVERGGKYYVNIGTDITIHCPSTHPPYTSDVSRIKSSLFETNQFVTSCLPSSHDGNNHWSQYYVCFSGTKPCKNSEVHINISGETINTVTGESYRETGGRIKDGSGTLTPHEAYYPLDCSDDWYKNFDMELPRCNNGVWSSHTAYCKAKYCTVEDVTSWANSTPLNKVGLVQDNTDVKVFYNTHYKFKCLHNNRIQQKDGKIFSCNYAGDNPVGVKNHTPGWQHEKYCLNSKPLCSHTYHYNLDDNVVWLTTDTTYKYNLDERVVWGTASKTSNKVWNDYDHGCINHCSIFDPHDKEYKVHFTKTCTWTQNEYVCNNKRDFLLLGELAHFYFFAENKRTYEKTWFDTKEDPDRNWCENNIPNMDFKPNSVTFLEDGGVMNRL